MEQRRRRVRCVGVREPPSPPVPRDVHHSSAHTRATGSAKKTNYKCPTQGPILRQLSSAQLRSSPPVPLPRA